MRDHVGRNVQGRCDSGEEGCGDYGIFKEGAGTAAVGFAFDDEHSLAVADLANSVVDVDGGGDLACEVAGQVRVGESGFCPGVEAEGYCRDDVAVAVGGVEDAAAVGE